jgi:hypothetical protein
VVVVVVFTGDALPPWVGDGAAVRVYDMGANTG